MLLDMKKEDGPPPLHHEEGTFPGAHGTELYYQRWTQARPPRAVIAIVHGFGEHSGRYRAVVNHFVPLGLAVYGFDLRGHGRSPGPRGHINSWKEYREDVHRFLEFVRSRYPDTALFVYAHSMGGLIGLDAVLHQPVGIRGLIASAPALGGIPVSPLLMALGRVMSPVWPSFGATVTPKENGLSRDAAVNEAALADELNHSRATARFSTELADTMKRTTGAAGSLELPLLMLQGTDDRVVSPAVNRAFFERAGSEDKAWRQYEGGRHEPHNDVNAGEVMEDVERWIEARL